MNYFLIMYSSSIPLGKSWKLIPMHTKKIDELLFPMTYEVTQLMFLIYFWKLGLKKFIITATDHNIEIFFFFLFQNNFVNPSRQSYLLFVYIRRIAKKKIKSWKLKRGCQFCSYRPDKFIYFILSHILYRFFWKY